MVRCFRSFALALILVSLIGAAFAIGKSTVPRASLEALVAQALGDFLAGPGEKTNVRVGHCSAGRHGDELCRFHARGQEVRCRGVMRVREYDERWAGWADELRCGTPKRK